MHTEFEYELRNRVMLLRQNHVVAAHLRAAVVFEPQAGIQRVKSHTPKRQRLFIPVALPSRMARYWGRFLGIARNYYFFDDLFDEKMMSWLDARERTGERLLPALRDFCEYYGIQEDVLSLETLYRGYHRKRRKRRGPQRETRTPEKSKILSTLSS